MEQTFYILSLKHSPVHGRALWWRPSATGYTTDISQAGLYSQTEIDGDPRYFNNAVSTLAIERSKVEALAHLSVDYNKVKPQ